MRRSRAFSIALLSALLSVSVSSVRADQLVPPTPSWWPVLGYQLRPGKWIECNGGKWATDDCIDSVWAKAKKNGKWTKLTFSPNPLYSPEMTLQEVSTSSSDYAQWPIALASTYGDNAIPTAGVWLPPKGMMLNDADLPLMVDADFNGMKADPNRQDGWLQMELRPVNWYIGLSPDYTYRVVLKSTHLRAYARWISTMTPDADINWEDFGYVTFTSSAALFYEPFGAQWEDVCAGKVNDGRALHQEYRMMYNVAIWNNHKYELSPGQVVVATNGFQCTKGMYFDEASRTFVIGVGSVHFDTAGKVIVGWFDAWLDAQMLRTWWNYDAEKSTGSAQVQVTYEDGSTVAALTTATYEASTDRLHIVSSGFHYSAPTIRLSFKHGADKKTITCVKGKASKQVTALKPVCPTGWKKK